MNRRTFIHAAAALLPVFATTCRAADEPVAKDEKNVSFRNEIKDAITRGLEFIVKQQNADGSFGQDITHPALAALPAVALQRDPLGRHTRNPHSGVLLKTYGYLRKFAQPDGGIYNPANGLANYNTSVSMLALFNAGDAQDEKLIAAARAYVVGQQATGMAKEGTDGGIGYGTVGASPKRGHPDLDNTLIALEALRATQSTITDKPASKDLNWQAAIDFISRCQNLPETNKMAWASGDPANKGGFVYHPGHSNAGEVELPGGRKALRSYGSMSYAGLLSFIYADLKPGDPRLSAVLEWLKKNYTLDENPGLEKQGYYYYLHLMARGLAAAKVTDLEVGGKKVDWKRDLALKVMQLQQKDGGWVNETARWKENNPVLVTAYCTMALAVIYNEL